MLDSKPNPARILLVEDNPGDVLLLRLALAQHEPDYILEVLRDGAEAIHFMNDQWYTKEPEPCVIVLDWHLPKQDGNLVLQSIRETPGISHVRVVALASLVSPKEEMEMERLRVRLFRRKPSDLDGWHRLAGEIIQICREPALSPV